MSPTVPGGDVDLERRIGQRHDVYPVQLGWRLEGEDADVDLLGPEGAAYLTELSVSGAAVVAPVTPHVHVGTRLVVTFQGAEGTVVVRRTGVLQDPDYGFYGIELVDQSSPLTVKLYDTFLARRSRLAEWHDPRNQQQPPHTIFLP